MTAPVPSVQETCQRVLETKYIRIYLYANNFTLEMSKIYIQHVNNIKLKILYYLKSSGYQKHLCMQCYQTVPNPQV